jgi:hypothetical protein
MYNEEEYKQLKKKDPINKYRSAQFKKGMYAGYLEYFDKGSLIIGQAKMEVIKEFAEKIWKEGTPREQQDRDNINKLLKEYGIKI